MTTDTPANDRATPESVYAILETMSADDLRDLSRTLEAEYDLVVADGEAGSVFAPASESPDPDAVRATAVRRDIAEILADS